jgi:hypothetical protein
MLSSGCVARVLLVLCTSSIAWDGENLKFDILVEKAACDRLALLCHFSVGANKFAASQGEIGLRRLKNLGFQPAWAGFAFGCSGFLKGTPWRNRLDLK